MADGGLKTAATPWKAILATGDAGSGPRAEGPSHGVAAGFSLPLIFMRERTGEDRVEIRRRLWEELRNLIERIDIYPVGRFIMTEERVREMLSAVIDVSPEMAGTEKLQQIERGRLLRK